MLLSSVRLVDLNSCTYMRVSIAVSYEWQRGGDVVGQVSQNFCFESARSNIASLRSGKFLASVDIKMPILTFPFIAHQLSKLGVEAVYKTGCSS